MDIRQASEYLGISGDTLYRYASEGFIPAFKLGNRWRFKRSLLDAWMVKMSQPEGGRECDRDAAAEEAGGPSARKTKPQFSCSVLPSLWSVPPGLRR